MKFSDEIKKEMADQDIKPAELARLTGYSSQHISDLLSGERRWNEDSLNKVCAALGLTIKIDSESGKAEESCSEALVNPQ